VGKHIVAVVMAAVACCCSWYVYRVMGKKEGVTEQELAAPLTALVAACVSIVMAVFNAAWYLLYDREDLKAWRDERRNQAGPQLRKLLDCIRNEADNFDKLHNGKPPFSQYTEIKRLNFLRRICSRSATYGVIGGGLRNCLPRFPEWRRCRRDRRTWLRSYPWLRSWNRSLKLM